MRESPKRLIKTNTEEQRNGAPRVRRAARSAVPQRKALARESRADSDATRERARRSGRVVRRARLARSGSGAVVSRARGGARVDRHTGGVRLQPDLTNL